MAWYCSALSNTGLVDNLISTGIIVSPGVADAMRLVDRADFVDDLNSAYEDQPQIISNSGEMISAPHIHAHTLEYLLPRYSARKMIKFTYFHSHAS